MRRLWRGAGLSCEGDRSDIITHVLVTIVCIQTAWKTDNLIQKTKHNTECGFDTSEQAETNTLNLHMCVLTQVENTHHATVTHICTHICTYAPAGFFFFFFTCLTTEPKSWSTLKSASLFIWDSFSRRANGRISTEEDNFPEEVTSFSLFASLVDFLAGDLVSLSDFVVGESVPSSDFEVGSADFLSDLEVDIPALLTVLLGITALGDSFGSRSSVGRTARWMNF